MHLGDLAEAAAGRPRTLGRVAYGGGGQEGERSMELEAAIEAEAEEAAEDALACSVALATLLRALFASPHSNGNSAALGAGNTGGDYSEGENYEDDDYLFKSQRGKLIVPSLHRLVNKWCDAVGLTGKYGSHTLRKTWGYHQYHTFGTDISKLVKVFNHSSQKQTKDYLCLDEEQNFNIYLHEL
jgi:hypothetical protein